MPSLRKGGIFISLVVKISADISGFSKEMNKFSREMKNATKDWAALGGTFKSVGSALTKAVTAPLLGVAVASAKVGMDFEAAMSEVKAITGATSEEFERLEASAREMGATTRFTASESADALKYLALAGYDVDTAISTLPHVLNLAASGNMDLAKASDMLTDGMALMGLEASEAERVVDIMAQTSRRANTSVEQLGEAYLATGGMASEMKGGVDEASVALAILADNGLKGSEGGTKLRNVMLSLTAPTDKAAEKMKELGLDVFDAEGNIRSLDDIMGDLGGTLSNMTQDEKMNVLNTLFNRADIGAVNALLGTNEERWNELSVAIADADGVAQEMADTMQDNLKGRLLEMKSAFEEVGITIYQIMQPALEFLVSLLKSVADWFNNLSDSQQQLIVIVGAVVAAIGPLLTIIGTLIVVVAQVQAALVLLGVGGFAALAAPIAIAVAAIVGIIAIFVLFGDEIKAVWNNHIKPTFNQIINIITTALKPAFQSAFKAISTIVQDCFQLIRRIWNEILLPVFKLIQSFIQSVLLPAFKVVFTAIGSVVADAFGNIQSAWTGVLKPILNGIISFISGVFSGNWSKAWSGIVSIFSGIFAGIQAAAKAPINGVISMVNGMIKGLNGLSIPDWVPGVGGKGINIPTIPMLARGGKVGNSGSFIAGERGAELVEMSASGAKVTPLNASERAGGIGAALGGGTGGDNSDIVFWLQKLYERGQSLVVNGREFALATHDDYDAIGGAKTKLTERWA